ncbi:MAG: hypothetical protein AAB089_04955, partial [Nitrospirota bacterium]
LLKDSGNLFRVVHVHFTPISFKEVFNEILPENFDMGVTPVSRFATRCFACKTGHGYRANLRGHSLFLIPMSRFRPVPVPCFVVAKLRVMNL